MVTLAPITLENLPAFKAVRLRALEEDPGAFGSTYARESRFSEEEWQARVLRWNGEQGIGYLALDGGRPCGIAGALLEAADRLRGDQTLRTAATLVSIWTAPTHRQHGVGAMLVQAVLAWARSRDMTTMRLTVVSTNQSAIRFYQRLGFAMTGHTEHYPNDPELFEYEMAREI